MNHLFHTNNSSQPWLALALYRILLHSTAANAANDHLAAAVLDHIEEILPHCAGPVRLQLLANVLMPVAASYTGQHGRLVDRASAHSRHVFVTCLRLTSLCMTSDPCAGPPVFVRHQGLQVLHTLLNGDVPGEAGKSRTPSSGGDLSDDAEVRSIALLMTSSMFSRKLKPLDGQASVHVFTLRCPERKEAVAPSGGEGASWSSPSQLTAAQADVPPLEGARSFFRGLSFSWGNVEKRRLLEEMAADSPLGDASDPTYERQTMAVDEREQWRAETQRFVRSALQRLGRLPGGGNSAANGKSSTLSSLSDRTHWAVKRFSRMSLHNTDESDPEVAAAEKQQRTSESSGYRSASANDVSSLDERLNSTGSGRPLSSAAGSSTSTSRHQSSASSIVNNFDAIVLPHDVPGWRRLSECWRMIAVAVTSRQQQLQGDNTATVVIADYFVEVGGVDVSLKVVGALVRNFAASLTRDGDSEEVTSSDEEELTDVKLDLFASVLRICFEFACHPLKVEFGF